MAKRDMDFGPAPGLPGADTAYKGLHDRVQANFDEVWAKHGDGHELYPWPAGLTPTGVPPGTYTGPATFTINQYGQITAISGSSDVIAGQVYAGPVAPGTPGTPAFRKLYQSDLPPFLQAGTGAKERPMQEKMREWLSVADFTGCDPTGLTRSDAAFKAAQAQATVMGGATIIVPAGHYLIGDNVTVDTAIAVGSNTQWVGIGQPRIINRGLSAASRPMAFDIHDVHDATVQGFLIDGEQRVRFGISIHGVVEDISILDNVFRDHLTYPCTYGDSSLDSETARYLRLSIQRCSFIGVCGGESIGSGVNCFPRASLPDGTPASQGAIFRDLYFDIRQTPGEFLVVSKNTFQWQLAPPRSYLPGERITATDGSLRAYCCISGTGNSTVEPAGTGAVIVAGTYKWAYLGQAGAVLGAFAKQPPDWLPSTAYPTIGQQVRSPARRLYELIVPGTSAATGGPGETAGQETNPDITDGTAHWKYIGVFRNVTTTTPYNKGHSYSPGTQFKVIAHRNLPSDQKAAFITSVVAGEIVSVMVDPTSPGAGYTGNVQVWADDPTFAGRDAVFGDPRNAQDQGQIGIKISNADGNVLDNILIYGGLAYPINLTAGGSNYVCSKIRVREAGFGFTVTGNPQILNRKWVACATDVSVAGDTLQCRDTPTGPVVPHLFTDGMLVGFRETNDAFFPTYDLPRPIAIDDLLYVVSATGTAFKLSRSLGGAAIDLLDAGLGYFQVGRAAGLATQKISIRDFHYTRDGVLNASGTSCQLGGNLRDILIDNAEIDGSLAFVPYRATDALLGIRVPSITLHDGNIFIDPLHPAETYKTGGLVDAQFGTVNLYGDPAGVKATGRFILDDTSAAGLQLPVIGCTINEINLNGFYDVGVQLGGLNNRVNRVSARNGNLSGAATAAVVLDRGINNSWGPIGALVPRKAIAAFVPAAVYALNDLFYTFDPAASPKRKRFYKVLVGGAAGAAPGPVTDFNTSTGAVSVMFLWSQSNTHFYQNLIGGSTMPTLDSVEGECIDMADGVPNKGTKLLDLDNFTGDVSAGFGVPYSAVTARQQQGGPYVLSSATQDGFCFEGVADFIVLGWTWLVTTTTSADPGVQLRCGLVDGAGAIDTVRFGQMTSLINKAAGYMHAIANSGGAGGIADRLLPKRSELTLGFAGAKVGAGAVLLRAWLIPKR